MKKIIIAILITLFSLDNSFGKSAQRKVVIVASYDHELSLKRGIIKSLKSQLSSVDSLHTFYLNSKKTKIDVYENKAKQFIQNILKLKPKLVFLLDDNALKLLGPALVEKDIKVVFLGINGNPRDYLIQEHLEKTSGVLEKPLFIRGIFELRDFFKRAKVVTILFDNSQTSKILIDQIFDKNSLIKRHGLEVTYKIIKDFEDLKIYILKSNNNKDEQIFMGTLHGLKNKHGGPGVKIQTIFNWVDKNYHTSIYSFWHDTVGPNECIAAFGVDIKQQGIVAGKIATDFLENKNTRPRIITPKRGILFLSKHQLKKYKKESIIKNLKAVRLQD